MWAGVMVGVDDGNSNGQKRMSRGCGWCRGGIGPHWVSMVPMETLFGIDTAFVVLATCKPHARLGVLVVMLVSSGIMSCSPWCSHPIIHCLVCG
jgi:hypothetical protein